MIYSVLSKKDRIAVEVVNAIMIPRPFPAHSFID